jgi:hypothetical protein
MSCSCSWRVAFLAAADRALYNNIGISYDF